MGVSINKNISYCNDNDANQKQCVETTQKYLAMGVLQACIDAYCAPPCSEVKYNKVISSGAWPSVSVMNHYISKLNESGHHSGNDIFHTSKTQAELYSFLQQNLLKLDIYYENMSPEVIKSLPKYDWSTLLSNVGGTLGLWLGFSILTAMEVLELFLDFMIHTCSKLTSKRGHPVADSGFKDQDTGLQ